MSRDLRLHYAPDNASLVIRLALLERGLPFETILVDRTSRAQGSETYRSINPAGRIPALETNDGPIFETAAILLWLSDRFGGLLPAPDAPDRGAALSWLFFLSNTLHADLRLMFYAERYTADAAGLRASLAPQVTRSLNLLDAQVAQAAPWLGGDVPSPLDLYLCAMLRWCALYPQGGTGWFRLGDFPGLRALAIRTEARDSARIAAAAEGLGPRPFSAPQPANPPEGSAL